MNPYIISMIKNANMMNMFRNLMSLYLINLDVGFLIKKNTKIFIVEDVNLNYIDNEDFDTYLKKVCGSYQNYVKA